MPTATDRRRLRRAELEEGDDPSLVMSEDAYSLEMMDRRKEAPLEAPPGVNADESEVISHAKSAVGPSMIFATLTKRQPNGAKWDKPALSELSTRWIELLHTTGIDISCYDLEDHRMLVTLQSGWRGYDVKDFLLKESMVTEVEWDSVKYRPTPRPGGGAKRKAKKAKPSGAVASAEAEGARRTQEL